MNFVRATNQATKKSKPYEMKIKTNQATNLPKRDPNNHKVHAEQVLPRLWCLSFLEQSGTNNLEESVLVFSLS